MTIRTCEVQGFAFTELAGGTEPVMLYIHHIPASSARVTIASQATAWTMFLNLEENESAIDRFMSLSCEQLVHRFTSRLPQIVQHERTVRMAYLKHLLGQVREQINYKLAHPEQT